MGPGPDVDVYKLPACSSPGVSRLSDPVSAGGRCAPSPAAHAWRLSRLWSLHLPADLVRGEASQQVHMAGQSLLSLGR